MEKNMEKESIITVLEANIRENGVLIRNMAMELLSMQMEINIKDNGRMVKEVVQDAMSTQMEIFMMVNGYLISKKERENSKWQQETNMKETGWQERKMVLVIILFMFRSLHFCKWRHLLRRIPEWKQTRIRLIYMD